jgi:hypothetical protein
MDQYITVKRENGVEVNDPAERNLILLRYAAFLNENGNGENNINIIHQNPQQQQIQQHQVPIQIIEPQQPARKSAKANNVQNAQGANMQEQTKVGGYVRWLRIFQLEQHPDSFSFYPLLTISSLF